jgi:hypothetical protein
MSAIRDRAAWLAPASTSPRGDPTAPPAYRATSSLTTSRRRSAPAIFFAVIDAGADRDAAVG